MVKFTFTKDLVMQLGKLFQVLLPTVNVAASVKNLEAV